MKIYTKTGDQGETSLIGGHRVSKAHERLLAYGTVDELNSSIGLALAYLETGPLAEELRKVQSQLFSLGSHLAKPESVKIELPLLNTEHISRLEHCMDQWTQELPHLKNFILPGGSPAASHLHMSRTICRRAERAVVALKLKEDPCNAIEYLNRLSDFLFVSARYVNLKAGVTEILWKPDS